MKAYAEDWYMEDHQVVEITLFLQITVFVSIQSVTKSWPQTPDLGCVKRKLLQASHFY